MQQSSISSEKFKYTKHKTDSQILSEIGPPSVTVQELVPKEVKKIEKKKVKFSYWFEIVFIAIVTLVVLSSYIHNHF